MKASQQTIAERVDSYFRKSLEEECDSLRQDLDGWVQIYGTLSPIELLLLLAFNMKSRRLNNADAYFAAFSQTQIGTRKVDFFVILDEERGGPEPRRFRSAVVVECDGHDYHERTKEQAESDKKRDRAIQLLGHPVLRFTGREIWRDPDQCVEEVYSFLRSDTNKQHNRWRKQK